MSGIPCLYFDGRTSSRREAALDIERDGWLVVAVSGEAARQRYRWSEVVVPDRIARTPRFIRLPEGRVCEVRDNDALDALLAGLRHEVRRPRMFGRAVHALSNSWLGSAVALAAVAAVLFSFTEWGAPLLARSVVAATPPEVEALLGRNALGLMEDLRLVAPSELEPDRRNELLASFVAMRDLAGVEESTLKFYLGRRIGANAFALPGGTVVVTDELIELAEHDEEILAVLAHELGHVQGRHVLRRLAQTSSMLVLWSAFTGDVSASFLAVLGPDQLLAQRYSRAFEREADALAARLLKRQGISPTRLGDILQRLESGAVDAPAWLLSHPGAAERARSMEEADGLGDES